jgi:hypothetical protein
VFNLPFLHNQRRQKHHHAESPATPIIYEANFSQLLEVAQTLQGDI